MFRGDRLKRLRESHQYTHNELASLLDIGYAQIYRYESGKNEPTAEVLARMADVFGVSADYLLGRTDSTIPDFNTLSGKEREVITAWREGDYKKAITVIASD